jgi:hypothetical protein
MFTRLSGGNSGVFVTLLITAAIIILIRLFGPLPIDWDLSIQLEAALRMAQGLGLTNAFSPQLDLNQPPISETLIHFPPGLPVLLVAFLRLGIPLPIALKTIYSLTTAIGWLAWSCVASRCLVGSFRLGKYILPLSWVIAVILPLIYTPSWTIQGTDIFLWAGTPIVTLLLLYGFGKRLYPIATVWLGILIGLLLSFRYASGFLLIAALLVIFYRLFPKVKPLVTHCFIFFLSTTLVLIPSFLFISLAKAQPAVSSFNNLLDNHGAKYLDQSSGHWFSQSINTVFSGFSSLYFLTGIDARMIQSFLKKDPTLNIFVGLLFLLFLLSLPLVFVKYKKDCTNRGRSENRGLEISFLLSIIIVSFIVFSSLIAFKLTYTPLIFERYYLPLKFCLVLIAYKLLTIPGFFLPYKQIAKILVFAFVAYNLLVAPLYYGFDSGVKSFAALPFGLSPSQYPDIPYPSNKLFNEHEKVLNFLVELENKNPDALFFAQKYPMYMSYINFEDPSKFRRIPDQSFWGNAYLSEATKVFWISNFKDCPQICSSSGFFNSDSKEDAILALASLPNLKVVFQSSKDSTKIMVSDLPANYRFGG